MTKAKRCSPGASVRHPYLKSAEVLHAAFEERLELVARDVARDVGAAAFGVAHLAEHAAAGRGDAFDGLHRAVGVVSDIIRRTAGGVAVLEGQLAVLRELRDDFRRGDE